MIKTSKDELRSHLKFDLDIQADDLIFLFSGMRDFGIFENGPTGVLEVFQDLLCEGTLVIPTFTYSWSNQEAFDLKFTPAPLMGLVANQSLSCEGFLRTHHPNFSVNIYSKDDEAIKKIMPTNNDSFGPGSIFHNIYLHFPNAKILLLGGAFPDCSYRSTFIHTAQQIEGVWHRYLKTFNDPKGGDAEVTQYVRFLDANEFQNIKKLRPPSNFIFPIMEDFKQYSKDLSDSGILRTRGFGYGNSRLVNVGPSIDLFREGLLQNESYGLLNHA
jgi:aminoglycoside N3'-acetyltransferase